MSTLTYSENSIEKQDLEAYFQQFRKNIIGDVCTFESRNGKQDLLYADWIASGRLYEEIEKTMCEKIGPMVANTHSFSSETGKASTYAYKHARQIIKRHVNANENDILVTTGTGMTAAISKLQRLMGLKWPGAVKDKITLAPEERPVVFITHMEHHSNHVPWMETIADVVILDASPECLVDPSYLEKELKKYANRPLKIGSFSACSNVTGIITPYTRLAEIMHAHGGYCFLDFAASAPYVAIDMHPANPAHKIDAIFFSPHKFLGGPGTCGVLVFDKELYKAEVPDNPGGGNVKWTNPWGDYGYCDDIETKEDGGTPGFLQVMRAALSIRLKEKMGVENMKNRETQLLDLCFKNLREIPNVFILGDNAEKRIGCISFGVEGIHYNLIVRLLNDRFGIQVRGGWSCASTYSHHLFKMLEDNSKAVVDGIKTKNLSNKPGWVRISLHPVTTDAEVIRFCEAVKMIVENIEEWSACYTYNPASNEYECEEGDSAIIKTVEGWFEM